MVDVGRCTGCEVVERENSAADYDEVIHDPGCLFYGEQQQEQPFDKRVIEVILKELDKRGPLSEALINLLSRTL